MDLGGYVGFLCGFVDDLTFFESGEENTGEGEWMKYRRAILRWN
jgi:hypothetical protein